MKKMIFAMTIATGLLTASFANAQNAEKATPKVHKIAQAKTPAPKKATGETPKKTEPVAKTTPVKKAATTSKTEAKPAPVKNAKSAKTATGAAKTK